MPNQIHTVGIIDAFHRNGMSIHVPPETGIRKWYSYGGNAMNILFYIKLYVLTVPVFFAIDMLWLGVFAKGFYRRKLGFILSDDVNWAAAVVFYLLFIAGILIFAVRPALNENSWVQAVIFGALFGFFTYATYDLTNLATIKHWPLVVVVVDIFWGMFLCMLTALVSYNLSKWLI